MPALSYLLTHWGKETHICVCEHANIGSDNGLSPNRRQAIIWTNGGILLIEPLGTNFNEILIEIHTFSFKEIRLKMSSAKCRPFCLGLNVLIRSNKITYMCSKSSTKRKCNKINLIDLNFSVTYHNGSVYLVTMLTVHQIFIPLLCIAPSIMEALFAPVTDL